MARFYVDGKWVEVDELIEKAKKYDELVNEHQDEVFLKEMVTHQRKQLVVLKDKLEAIKTHLLEFPSLAMEILDKDEWMRDAEDWKSEHWKILKGQKNDDGISSVQA